MSTAKTIPISLTVNGRRTTRSVAPRLLLADFLRNDLGLTGTHVGCSHGVCGACTVLIDGRTARSCIAFAVQVDGADIRTVESLTERDKLGVIQQAFHEHHALQCGYCTPGFLMSTTALLRDDPNPSDEKIRATLAAHLCRCTGYVHIMQAVRTAAARLRDNEGKAV